MAEHSILLGNFRRSSLPRPLHGRIFSNLRTEGDCRDLNKLSQVSPRFRSAVQTFMKRDGNRPGVCLVNIGPDEDGGMGVTIALFPSNIPFYDLANLDGPQFKGWMGYPSIYVKLNGPEDPAFEQMDRLLSTTIERVVICCNYPVDSLCEKLLRNSTIGHLSILDTTLDDKTIPSILAISSRAKAVTICSHTLLQLTDPISFFVQFCSLGVPSVTLIDWNDENSDLFFCLTPYFWNNFLNKMLRDKTFDSVCVYSLEIYEGTSDVQLNLPDDPIQYIKWKKESK